MRIPIQLRLFLTILAVLLVAMGLAAVLTWFAVEQLYLNTQKENLLAQAQLTASALSGEALPILPVEPYSQAANVQPGIHTRLLGEQGGVFINVPIVGEGSPVQVPSLENTASISPDDLLQRHEIQSAQQGIPATAIRKVAAVENRRVLYAGAPVFSPDGTIQGIVYLATPLPAANLPTYIIWRLIGTVLVALVLAGAVGAFLSRHIARPLERLARAASAVAKGDLDQYVPMDSEIAEIHSLGYAFNDMMANLRQSEKVKNAFIADVTHELRTPLTVINGTIETLEDGAIDDLEGRAPLLASMQAETARLIRLVNDLLVLTRADAGALNLKLEKVNLQTLVCARCERLSALAEPRQLTFAVDVRGQAEVWGDSDRLTQVLDNLLNNAIRHAPVGSTVAVAIQREGQDIRCAISDEGAGIPEEQLPYIFERFYRVDSSRNRHSGGSGLGLAIVHSLVQAHGGRVTAESAVGQGTTLTFWLPADTNCQ